ncbi:toxin-antitoxin system YwqK family antitoxin [Hymenobacter guriensis]|uniref:Toxin-antitoxin system YwqK family antitoxin n=1 Tax=Hymenobacter guriensis TaxID=2793065 RepID=A0ABS0L319_9BACT|nr:hypothetical protein [Hymenobacter guriensis]MBG8554512.1 hypothetical protein [Hymenobacter guriensis]
MTGGCRTAQTVPANVPTAKLNRFDSQNERQGQWRTYYDEGSTQLATAGRYRHGKLVGRWRYYGPQNGLEREEQHYWWRPGLLFIQEYHANGKLAKQGRARIVREADIVHFYWFGPWLEYAPSGEAVSRAWYEMGQLRRREKLPTAPKASQPAAPGQQE